MGSPLTWICLVFALVVFIEFLLFIRSQNVRSNLELCECKSVPTSRGRLLAGSEARVDDLRWIASIYSISVDKSSGDHYYLHKCSATLITDRFLLTTTYCKENLPSNATKLYAAVGGSDRSLTYLYLSTANSRMIVEFHSPNDSPAPKSKTGRLAVTKHSIAIAQLEKPFVLGSKTNIYPACLLEQSSKHFSNALLIASYGEASDAPGIDTEQRITSNEVSHVFTGQTSLQMTRMKQTADCDKIINNFHASDEICASSEKGSLFKGDIGSALHYEYESGRLYVVGVAIAENQGRTAVFETVYRNLKWIDSIVGSKRCNDVRSFKFSFKKLVWFLLVVLLTGAAAMAALYYSDIEAFRMIQSKYLPASLKGKLNAAEQKPNEQKPNEQKPNEQKPNEPNPNEPNPNKPTPNKPNPNKPNEPNPTETKAAQ